MYGKPLDTPLLFEPTERYSAVFGSGFHTYVKIRLIRRNERRHFSMKSTIGKRLGRNGYRNLDGVL